MYLRQQVSRKIYNAHKELVEEKIYTLLIDGHNLLKVCMADPKVNNNGVHIGGIIQFLIKMRQMLLKKDFDYVYVFWDGDNSGQLRFEIYNDYKANRDKNYYSSEYEKQVNDYVKKCYAHFSAKNVENEKKKEKEREEFEREKTILQNMLEELFIRQVSVDLIESDDLIAYYTNNKKENEKIVIMSSDMDLSQLLSEDVCIYSTILKKFITIENYKEIEGFHYENVVIKKIICGDSSDNIKGIKGVGEDTLFKLIPEIKDRKITLDDVIQKAKENIIERENKKKKPLKYTLNIINKVTDGIQGENIYEINNKIINLSSPMLTEEAIHEMDEIRYNVIDPDNRSFENLLKMVFENGLSDFYESDKFANFFSAFARIIDKEKKRN